MKLSERMKRQQVRPEIMPISILRNWIPLAEQLEEENDSLKMALSDIGEANASGDIDLLMNIISDVVHTKEIGDEQKRRL